MPDHGEDPLNFPAKRFEDSPPSNAVIQPASPSTPVPEGDPKPSLTQLPHRITRRAVVGWVMYDLANTIFTMGVISLYFPLWVRETVGAERADSVFGVIVAISMGIIFFASPLLGAMTDRARRRMPFLVVSTLICVALTLVLGRAGFYFSALCFIVANVAYQAGLQFYDALLPEVSTEENRGRIGGIGVGIGYFGSYLAIGIGLLFQDASKPTLFSIIGISFLVFSIPCMIFVRERGNPNPRPINFGMILNSTRETIRTLRSSGQYPGLLRFLIGRVLYTDPINTVIQVMALYTVNVAIHSGLSGDEGEKRAKVILLSAVTFAVVGGFFWGWLTDRLGPKRTLNLVLKSWMGIFVFASCIGWFGWPLWTMYLLAALAGFALGGVWAADRPYMLRLTPPSRIGEFYGLYGMVGRFSAVTGPVLWALGTSLMIRVFHVPALKAQATTLLALLGLMVLSYVILQPVSDERRQWSESDRGVS
ncbi:MAG: MFS transporter [Verrucomicrobiota bacterium]|jgi:MFS transporter, UMF1 family